MRKRWNVIVLAVCAALVAAGVLGVVMRAPRGAHAPVHRAVKAALDGDLEKMLDSFDPQSAEAALLQSGLGGLLTPQEFWAALGLSQSGVTVDSARLVGTASAPGEGAHRQVTAYIRVRGTADDSGEAVEYVVQQRFHCTQADGRWRITD